MKKKILAVILAVITLLSVSVTVSAAGSSNVTEIVKILRTAMKDFSGSLGGAEAMSSKETYTSPVTGKKITIPGKGLASVTVDGAKQKLIPAENKVNKISESHPYDNIFYAYLDGYGMDFSTSERLCFWLAQKPISAELTDCTETSCSNGRCRKCYNGNCNECLGTGREYDVILGEYLSCFKCNGTGKCTVCNGTGKCLTCNGEGKVSTSLSVVSKGKWKAGTTYKLGEMNNNGCYASLRGYYKPTYSTNTIYTKDNANYFENVQFKIIKRKGNDIKWYFYMKTSYDGKTHTFEGVAHTVRGKGKGKVPSTNTGNGGGGSGGSGDNGSIGLSCLVCGGSGKCSGCIGGRCTICFGKGYVEVPTYGTGDSGRADCAGCVGGICSKCSGSGNCIYCSGSGKR